MDCPKCKKSNDAGKEFCKQCGYKLVRTDDTDGRVSKKKSLMGNKYILRTVIFLVIVGGIYAWSYFGSDNGNTYSGLVSVGDFYCTDYHSAEADTKAPNVDYTDEIERLEILGEELDSMIINEASQESVDNYNELLDDYNEQFDQLESDIISTEGSIEDHNTKIDAYNNYLEINCEKE